MPFCISISAAGSLDKMYFAISKANTEYKTYWKSNSTSKGERMETRCHRTLYGIELMVVPIFRAAICEECRTKRIKTLC